MRAKNGYKFYKRRSPYIGRMLHRYFLTRTVRRNRKPGPDDIGRDWCDDSCPLCTPEVAKVDALLLDALQRKLTAHDKPPGRRTRQPWYYDA